MKKLIYLLILFSLIGCKSEIKHNDFLTDSDWKDILYNSFALTHVKKPYIFNKFGNSKLKNIISFTYLNSTFLGYEVNDSILNYIKTRENKPIINQLDTILNIQFITDTIGFQENYLIYSEPFYINDKILCVAVSKKELSENKKYQIVLFYKRNSNKSLSLLGYYDVNKEMFYKATYLK